MLDVDDDDEFEDDDYEDEDEEEEAPKKTPPEMDDADLELAARELEVLLLIDPAFLEAWAVAAEKRAEKMMLNPQSLTQLDSAAIWLACARIMRITSLRAEARNAAWKIIEETFRLRNL